MKLIVGLGNPGRKYEQTRHNVGFQVLDRVAGRLGVASSRQRFRGRLGEGQCGAERVLLLCPETYMNRSGGSVGEAFEFYKLTEEQLLVVCDDFNLPLGRIRLRAKGSAGGQKGLQDIIRRIGTDEIPRLRVGIGPPPEQWDVADFVLSRFPKSELATVEEIVDRSAQAVEVWLRSGMEESMNRYNASVSP